MNKRWFLKFLVLAIIAKFIFASLVTTLIIAFILGLRKDDNLPLKGFIIGILFGIEAGILSFISTAFPGVSVWLHIVRSINIPIADPFSFAAMQFIAFGYIMVFEILFTLLIIRIASLFADALQQKHVNIQW